jgi:hypothetical protein
MRAKVISDISIDLDGMMRDGISPDVGCYESQF